MTKYKNKKWGQYKSGLEVAAAKLLEEAGIPFEYEPWVVRLIEPSKWNGISYESVGKKKVFKQNNSIRKADYTPDFVGKGWVMETKGMKTQDFIIRWKLFKQYLTNNSLDFVLFVPTNQKEIKESIKIIKELFYGTEENQSESINRRSGANITQSKNRSSKASNRKGFSRNGFRRKNSSTKST